jgi:hypothetical protein
MILRPSSFSVLLLVALLVSGGRLAAETAPSWMAQSKASLEAELTAKFGEGQRERIQRGLKQAGDFWRSEDGDAAAFADFVRTNFAGDTTTFDALFNRMEFILESLDGHMLEIGRDLQRQTALDLGPIYPFDEIVAAYDASAHLNDDFFSNKLAFVVLLNFPLTTLEVRLKEGDSWSRRHWAEARLTDRFARRIPAEVNLAIARAAADSDQYIAQYNIWMHHVVDEKGSRLFAPKLRLLSHWNLRDEIRADYSEGAAALPKQEAIQKIMERIVTQTIPAAVVDNPSLDWNPYTNAVKPAAAHDADPPRPPASGTGPEPDTRYAMLLKTYQAARQADPYCPTAPTLIARRFDEDRQIPEPRVRAMLEQVLSSPLAPETARLIERRLGRKLQPFDLWYNGFKPRGAYTEAQLDEAVRTRFPTAESYKQAIPDLLMQLGFTREKAEFLAANIIVDPARGSGHALGAERRGDQAHLRTRVEKDGMNYKGFNIAVHEMGHTVEQTFSLNGVDHTLLRGVPNTAFTEALAFVFQAHDLELLGLAKPDAKSHALKTLDEFWGTYEISGVALVDMGVWHWMYDHPDATPAQLKDATLSIARDIWNRFYAPVFGKRDVELLAIYSHMIDSFLYLPDYPLGHMIAFQIERQMEKAGNIGGEFERMATIGNIAPDLWMKKATGSPVGPEALLTETKTALAEAEKR